MNKYLQAVKTATKFNDTFMPGQNGTSLSCPKKLLKYLCMLRGLYVHYSELRVKKYLQAVIVHFDLTLI